MSLKGYKNVNRHGGADPMTENSKDVVVPPYFRNTFCIMGVVALNRSIGEDNHDSAACMDFISSMVASRWLVRGDRIVVDNAIMHSGSSAGILSDFIMECTGFGWRAADDCSCSISYQGSRIKTNSTELGYVCGEGTIGVVELWLGM